MKGVVWHPRTGRSSDGPNEPGERREPGIKSKDKSYHRVYKKNRRTRDGRITDIRVGASPLVTVANAWAEAVRRGPCWPYCSDHWKNPRPFVYRR